MNNKIFNNFDHNLKQNNFYYDLRRTFGEFFGEDDNLALNRRYFKIAGITVCVESELDLTKIKFKDELMAFAVDGPGDDNITLRHHFGLPDLEDIDLGEEIYRKIPWNIYNNNNIWIYQGFSSPHGVQTIHRIALFSSDHTKAIIYSDPKYIELILKYGWRALSMLTTDQIWLSPLLADRSAVLLHSAAAIVDGHGHIFVGHSNAGKSTIVELLKTAQRQQKLDIEILCDDRNIIRLWPDGWQVHGTWSHGDVADVSPKAAPLKGIFFLEQAIENEIVVITDHKLIWRLLLATLIRSLPTGKWWNREIDILEQIIYQVPCYIMRFNKTGTIVAELKALLK